MDNVKNNERKKMTPREPDAIKDIQNRLNRVVGQINGIKTMVENDRYCIDILIQLMACESALKVVGEMIFKEHLKTCFVKKIREGDENAIDEVMQVLKNLR